MKKVTNECHLKTEVQLGVSASLFYKIRDRLLDAGQACLVVSGRMPSTAGTLYRNCADLFGSMLRMELAQTADTQVVYVVYDPEIGREHDPMAVTGTGVEPPLGKLTY